MSQRPRSRQHLTHTPGPTFCFSSSRALDMRSSSIIADCCAIKLRSATSRGSPFSAAAAIFTLLCDRHFYSKIKDATLQRPQSRLNLLYIGCSGSILVELAIFSSVKFDSGHESSLICAIFIFAKKCGPHTPSPAQAPMPLPLLAHAFNTPPTARGRPRRPSTPERFPTPPA